MKVYNELIVIHSDQINNDNLHNQDLLKFVQKWHYEKL